jgi:4-amino-4-deoxy-L-arabinose transferase-like glycosyltransferase
VSFRGFCWLLVALAPLYLTLAAVVPPADDELYYWCWSERLQWSYYDHPPMTAYMIRAATAVFGDTLFAIRLPAVVSTLTVLAVIGWLTWPRGLLPFAVATPLFTVGAVIVTPDTPLLMFWALYTTWLVAIHKRLLSRHLAVPGHESDIDVADPGAGSTGTIPLHLWLLGGVILGCGILGKYTTGLAVIAGFLSFALAGHWRRWLFGYAIHLGVAFVVTLPILIHNIRHDFAPLLYQWGHSMGSPEPGLKPFAEFVGLQLLLFGVLPFVILVWTLWNFRALRQDPRLRVCACLFAFPFAFFLFKATRGPLEGNWALACYIAVWPLAATWYETVKQSAVWRRLTVASFAAPIAAVALLMVHLVWPLQAIPPEYDRITRQVTKVAVARDVRAQLTRTGEPAPVFATNYQWTALLRFSGIDAHQVAGYGRPSHFTQTPERPAEHDRLYVFSEGFLPEEYVPGFLPRIVGRFPLVVRGQEVAVLWLLEYARPGAAGAQSAWSASAGRLDHAP